MAGEWLEVRCTQRDFLQLFDERPPAAAPAFEAVLSVVFEPPGRGVRRLPSIYLGPSQVFTARRPEELKQHLHRALELLRASVEEPTYALTPVRFDEEIGLYARDLAVRDTFRVLLRRAGLLFADEPFVSLSRDGTFVGSWGPFSPSFVILGHYDEEDPKKVLTTKGAFVPFTLATFRLGSVSAPELKRLVSISKDLVAMSSADTAALTAALRAELGH